MLLSHGCRVPHNAYFWTIRHIPDGIFQESEQHRFYVARCSTCYASLTPSLFPLILSSIEKHKHNSSSRVTIPFFVFKWTSDYSCHRLLLFWIKTIVPSYMLKNLYCYLVSKACIYHSCFLSYRLATTCTRCCYRFFCLDFPTIVWSFVLRNE